MRMLCLESLSGSPVSVTLNTGGLNHLDGIQSTGKESNQIRSSAAPRTGLDLQEEQDCGFIPSTSPCRLWDQGSGCRRLQGPSVWLFGADYDCGG